MTDSTEPRSAEWLKPCPFCGEEAEIERYGNHRQSTIYRCTFCSCSLETGEEWGHGNRWNERALPRPTTDTVERKKALHEIAKLHTDWNAVASPLAMNSAIADIIRALPSAGGGEVEKLRELLHKAHFELTREGCLDEQFAFAKSLTAALQQEQDHD